MDKKIVAEAKRRSPRRTKKDPPPERIVIVGSTQWKNKAAIRKALRAFNYKQIDCVIVGNANGAETMAQSVCREQKFNLIVAPPNYERDGYNAIYYRNHWVWQLFKPTWVLAFHENAEHDGSTSSYIKIAKSKHANWKLVTK